MKRKRINRGGILLLVIAMLLVIAIVFETTNNSIQKKTAQSLVDKVTGIVADAMILPEDMRDRILSEKELDKYLEDFKSKLEGYYAEGEIVSKNDSVLATIDCIKNYFMFGSASEKKAYYSVSEFDALANINDSLNEYTTSFTVSFSEKENGQLSENYSFSFRLVKEDGKWKIWSLRF